MSHHPFAGPCDCGQHSNEISRRQFLRTTIGTAAIAAAGSLPVLVPQTARSAPTPKSASETLVTTFYKSLTEPQRQAVCFPFDHPLRSKVDNNWHIVDKKLASFFTKDQQAMVREIFVKLHSPEYAQKVLQQVEHDAGKPGFGGCAGAPFGGAGRGKFEFGFTGGPVTRGWGGNSVPGGGFGGPIF